VFWSVCIAESSLAIAGVLLFRRGRWKETELVADVGARTDAIGAGASDARADPSRR
jgi:hypothetical protein